MSPVPETSVLVRTFNEEKHLPKLMEGLATQTYRDYEIVFVDSGSYDRTRDIAARHTDRILRIDSSDFTYGYSLNVGTEACVGQFVAIVSAHTKPLNDDWLGNLIAPFREENTAMVYGRQLGWEATKFSDAIDLQRTFGREPKLLTPPEFFAHNANSAIRKELWQTHRFDEALPGLEDIEWAKYWMTRGFHVAYEPQAALYHIHEESWPQIRRRFYREAVAAKMIGVSNPWDAPVGLVAETGRVVSDLYRAVRADNVFRRAPEIFSFRFNKAVGMTRGLLNGTSATDVHSKESMFFDRRCRAVVVSAAGQAFLEEIELPRIKPGEVLIRVAYAGVCPTDYEIIDGTHAYLRDGTSSYPIVPGHEFSGRVVAMGVNVDSLNEGDLVVGAPIQGCGRCAECGRGSEIGCVERVEMGFSGHHGTFSEYVVLPSQFVARIPDGVDLRSASLAEPLAVVLKGLTRLRRALPRSSGNGLRCLVAGAGPQGHFCAQVLALQGNEVTVYDRSPSRREYFSGTDVSVTDRLDDLDSFDVMVELTGDSKALETMLVQSPPGATILALGVPSMRQRFMFENSVAYDKTVVGSVGSGIVEIEEALAMLPSLSLGQYFQDILPLHDFRDAVASAGRRDHLKTLLKVDVA